MLLLTKWPFRALPTELGIGAVSVVGYVREAFVVKFQGGFVGIFLPIFKYSH